MEKPRVSVVVPTYNAAAHLAPLLAAWRRQKPVSPDEVLVVDSGSTDDTRRTAAELGCRVIKWERPFDHGLARDAGIAAAGGELVVLTVQDALPTDENLLARLTAPFAEAAVAGVSGRQIPPPDGPLELRLKQQRDEQEWGIRAGRPLDKTPKTPPVVRLSEHPDYTKYSPAEKIKLYRFDNVCAALRRSVWKNIPLGSCRYAEDLLWCRRVLEAGYATAFIPEATVIHAHARSFGYEFRRALLDAWVLDREFGFRRSLNPRLLRELKEAKIPADGKLASEDAATRKTTRGVRLRALRTYAAHGAARISYGWLLRPLRLADRLLPRLTRDI